MCTFNTKTNLRTKVLEQLITSENSCVEVVQRERDLRTWPYHGNNFSSATKEELNALVGKFVKDLHGIVLGSKNIKILSNYAVIDDDGLNNFSIRADFFVFKPIPGRELPAIVTKKSNDHVGCLVYNTFNMSIPKPEGVLNWEGNNVEIGQEVVALVTRVKLESRIPYIRGEFLQKSPVNKKLKFTDADEINEDKKESSLDKEDIKIADDTGNATKKKKRSRKSLENEGDRTILDEPIEMKEDCPDEKFCGVQDDSLRKKKKKSRKSLENDNENIECEKESEKRRNSSHNEVLMSDEPIEMKEDCPDEVSDVQDYSVRKKKSRRSLENDNENIECEKESKKRRNSSHNQVSMSDEPIEMKEDCPDEVSNEKFCDVQDDSVRKKKKKSRRSLENDNENIACEKESKKRRNSSHNEVLMSDEPIEMKEECPSGVGIEPVCDMEDNSMGKKKSRRSLENDNESMESERKSKKRRNSSYIEEGGETKRRKVA